MRQIDFSGRHAIVTGGTGALGAAVVALLLDAGAECHVPVLDSSELEGFAHAADARVHLGEGVDLSDEAAAEAFFARAALAAGGSVWASIHCVGGFAMAPIEEAAYADYQQLMAMNADSAYLCCREAVRQMVRGGTGGRIVNVAARPAVVPSAGVQMTAYTMSKAAVAALSESLAAEVVDRGVLVNAVAPSIIDTPANRRAMPGADYAAWPTPAQVSSAICWLASPQNEVTRGAVLEVYGRS